LNTGDNLEYLYVNGMATLRRVRWKPRLTD